MRHRASIRQMAKSRIAAGMKSSKMSREKLDRINLHLLRRQLFLELARHERSESDAIETILRHLRIRPLPGAVLLVRVDALADPLNCPDETQRKASLDRARGVIEIALAKFPVSLVEAITSERLGVILSGGSRSTISEDEVRGAAEHLCHLAHLNGSGALTLGIGSVSDDCQGLVRSYREAEQALSYQLFLGNDRPIAWGDVMTRAREADRAVKSGPFPVKKERQLLERIVAGDRDGTIQALDGLMEALRGQPGMTPTTFKYHLMETVVVLCRVAARIGADADMLADANLKCVETVLKIDSYPALRSALRVLAEDLIDVAPGSRRAAESDVITLAKRYIAENYAKDPSLREVSRLVHLSPYHFCRLFAEQNGWGFKEHLNKVRIEAAKDLLRNSPAKIKQTAAYVGFKDVSYFVRLFRRLEGVTPAQYRRSVGQGEV